MPAYTSGQITEGLKRSTNILADKQKLFQDARYFVAQKPAAEDFSETCDGYYRGHKVIPGPKANPKLSPILNVRDIRIAEQVHFIRFVDNLTTDGADEDTRRALFTIMDKHEADEYEAVLKRLQEEREKSK